MVLALMPVAGITAVAAGVSYKPGDINQDDDVNLADLGILLANFGARVFLPTTSESIAKEV